MIRMRVGRHRKAAGRQCRNRLDDQKVVIDLLGRIPPEKGGRGGLGVRVIDGVCSEPLYEAVCRFEDIYFPSRSGFVDPGGPMLAKIEMLAGNGKSNAPEGRVIIESVTAISTSARDRSVVEKLSDDLFDDSDVRGDWTAGELVAIDPLIKLASKYLEDSIHWRRRNIPGKAILFGRAYLTDFDPKPKINDQAPGTSGFIGWLTSNPKTKIRFYGNHIMDESDGFVDYSKEAIEAPPLPNQYSAFPVTLNQYITTVILPALLLCDTGRCFKIPAYTSNLVNDLYDNKWKELSPYYNTYYVP